MAGPLRRRPRLRLSVLHRAGPLAARQEHHDVTRERPDLVLAVGRPGAGDPIPAAPGFVGTRRGVATRHRDRHVSPGRPGAGPPPGGQQRPGARGARSLHRRRRTDRAGGPRLRAACAGFECARDGRAAAGTGDDHRAAAQLRGRLRGKGTVPPERGAAGVLHQHRADLHADRSAAGRLVPATRRRSARRPRRDPVAPPRRGPVPVLRHPVDRVRHHRPHRCRLLRARRGAATPTRRGPPPPRDREAGTPLTPDEKLADRYGRRR